MTPNGIVVVGYVLIALFLWPTPFVALPATVQTDPAPLRTFHLNNQVACADAAGYGTEAKPYCTLKYVASWWRPGDLFLLHSKRDGSGPVDVTRSGTATAPITVRGVGDHPVIGSFVDVKDEDFVPVPTMPGVFRLAGAPNGVVWQTYFPPILVDDVNASKYTMVDTDGPLQMVAAPDDAILAKVEGTYRYSSTDGMRVHPYGSQQPSVTSSDLVIGTGRTMNFSSSMIGIIFENLTITYAGSVYSFSFNGKGHRLRDMRWAGVPMTLRGSGHVVERYKISHVIYRDAPYWSWTESANGTAAAIWGSGHRLLNGESMHSWNNDLSTENATGVEVDGIRMHGAPNHCGTAREGDRQTIRNSLSYNCQDAWWLKNVQNFTAEHIVTWHGIALESVAKPLGPITIRNSLFNGQFTFVRGPMEYCTWEKGSLLENSIVSATASIERCADNTVYPLKEYVAKCEAGTFTDCMTVRNVTYVTDWKTVIKDGLWNAALADSWDVSLVPGSPAINIGASTTRFDILRVPRPQPAGGLSDAGIYEFTTDLPSPAAQGAPTVSRK